jgi:hypothetical protein
MMNTKKLRVLLQALTDGPVTLHAFKCQIGASQNEINYMISHKWVCLGTTQTNVWVCITEAGYQRLRQLDKAQLEALVLQEVT